MANSPREYAASGEAEMDALTARLNNGFLKFMTGSQPAVDVALTGSAVATLDFGATAFGASASVTGVVSASANAIASDTNAAGGTIGYAALLKSDGTTVVLTCSVGTSGADINIVSLTVPGGATVSCSSLVLSRSQT